MGDRNGPDEQGPDTYHLADVWEAKYDGDWRWEVRDGQFFELTDSGGSTEGGAQVFRVVPAKVMVFGDEHGQTTYRF